MKYDTIKVNIVNQFGNERIFPVEGDTPAELLTRLTGKKTLDRNDIEIIKELGFTVTVEPTVNVL